ncbi:hypothetical protein [Acidianus infernus]|uniref:hypothetical protein n=1 Tax=Acidianus infernus TaxID=12915 RepID=UPI0012DD6F30|nr:hypothetical protein [Acidianus infernus]
MNKNLMESDLFTENFPYKVKDYVDDFASSSNYIVKQWQESTELRALNYLKL